VLTVFLVALAMSFALAHAAELPGKMRLGREAYLAVQPIYYPGFTLGAIAEPAAIVATSVLLVLTWSEGSASWLVLAAFVSLLLMHAVYWLVTHPVNRVWVTEQPLGSAGAGFFAVGPKGTRGADVTRGEEWKSLRNRWEYSHVARAILAIVNLVMLLIWITL
jgi:hypothetical protein